MIGRFHIVHQKPDMVEAFADRVGDIELGSLGIPVEFQMPV
jgi:hypothetical protein